jgi:hypothetical protein
MDAVDDDGNGNKRTIKNDDDSNNNKEVSFSLRDIQNAFPKESEEETMVFAHIEEINPVYDNNNSNNNTNNDDNGNNKTKTKTTATTLPVDFVDSMQQLKRSNQILMKEKEKAKEEKKPKSSKTDVTLIVGGDKGEIADDDDDEEDEDDEEEEDKVDKVDNGIDVEMGGRRRLIRGQRPKLKKKPTTEEELYNYTSFIVSTRKILLDNNNDNDNNKNTEEEQEQESLTNAETFAINAFGIFVGGNGNGSGNGNGNGDDGRGNKRGTSGNSKSGNGNGNNHNSIRESFGDALYHVKFNFVDTFKFIRNLLCYFIIPGFIIAMVLFYGKYVCMYVYYHLFI